LPSQVKRALDFLSGTRDAWRPTLARFPSINFEQLLDDLKIPERAQEIREETNTESAITLYTNVVEEVNLDLRRRFTESQGQFNEAERLYDQRIQESMLGPEAEVRVVAAAEECKGDFESQVTEDYLPLNSALHDVNEINDEYRYFRQHHGLTQRTPVVKDYTNKPAALWWIALVVLIETVANGLFFSQGSPAGLIGGFSEAIFLSVLNISLAAVLGLFALRYILHRSWFWRITSAMSLLLLVAATFALNLLIAHYREAFALAEGAAVRFDLVIQRLQTEPFAMQQPESWLLGALGIVFNVFAAYKFYQISDPYPGYTSLAYRRNQASDILADQARICLENLNQHRNHSVTQIDSIIELIERNRSELELASRGRARLIEEYRDHLESLGELGNALSARLNALSDIHRRVDSEALPKIEIPQSDSLPSAAHSSTDVHERLADLMKEAVSDISDKYTSESTAIREKLQLTGVR